MTQTANALLTKEDFVKRTDLPDWLLKEYRTFHNTVIDKTFPCYFGMNGELKGELRYAFVTQDDWSNLPAALQSFLTLFKEPRHKRHGLFVFVEPFNLIQQKSPTSISGRMNARKVFQTEGVQNPRCFKLSHRPMLGILRGVNCAVPNSKSQRNYAETQLIIEGSLEDYRKQFWEILQYLHEVDEIEWPAGSPRDSEHYLWDFHFHGEPIFVFANAPAYKQRKTRDLGNAMVIGFQPRRIFEGLKGTEPGGMMSREKVRERVAVWDQLPKHPDISHFGDPTHHEWKQFFIGDDAEPIQGTCPFTHKDME